jgi:hypothetical protein
MEPASATGTGLRVARLAANGARRDYEGPYPFFDRQGRLID